MKEVLELDGYTLDNGDIRGVTPKKVERYTRGFIFKKEYAYTYYNVVGRILITDRNIINVYTTSKWDVEKAFCFINQVKSLVANFKADFIQGINFYRDTEYSDMCCTDEPQMRYC
jgi:hypothetical protein